MAISLMMSALLFELWVKVKFNMATFVGLSDRAHEHVVHKVNNMVKCSLNAFITPKWCVLDMVTIEN